METNLMQNPSGDNLENNSKRKKKKIAKVKAIKEDGHQIKDQMDDTLEASDQINDESKKNLFDENITLLPLAEHPELHSGSTLNASAAVDTKKIKRRKRKNKKKKVNVINEVQSMDQIDTKKKKKRKKNRKKVNVLNEVLKMDQKEMDTGTAEYLAEIKDEMDNNLEASDKIICHTRVNIELEKKLFYNERTVVSLGKHPILAAQTVISCEGNTDTKKSKKRIKSKKNVNIMNGVQIMDLDHSKLDAESVEDVSEMNMVKKKSKRRKKIKKKVNFMNGVQSMGQTEMNMAITENFAEFTGDDLKASDEITNCFVVNTESEKSLQEKHITVLPLPEHPKLDSTENAFEGNVVMKKKKTINRIKKKVTILNEVQRMEPMEMNKGTTINLAEIKYQVGDNVEASDKIIEHNGVSYESRKLPDNDVTMLPLVEHLKLEARSIEKAFECDMEMNKINVTNGVQSINQEEINTGTRKKKMKKTKKGKDEVQIMDQDNAMLNTHEPGQCHVTMLPLVKHLKLDARSKEKAFECDMEMNKINVMNGVQSINQEEINTGTRKKKMKKTKKGKDEVQIMDQDNAMLNTLPDECQVAASDTALENNYGTQESQSSVRKELGTCHSDCDIYNPSATSPNMVHDMKIPISLSKHGEDVLLSNVIEVSRNEASESFESLHKPYPVRAAQENDKLVYGLTEINDEIIVDQGKCAAEGRSIFSTCNDLSFSDVKEEKCSLVGLGQSPRPTLVTSYRRKLLVLDINGLLADIVMPAPKDCRGDIHMWGRAIFKRPFYEDFLRFCFQNFDVGIWSSRTKRIIDKVVDYLLGNMKHKLLFCWDMTHATETGFKTLENIRKPLVCKELRNIWENSNPRFPWKKGDYDESNTLLLDDSPYKAMLNPLNTAIFPKSFSYKDESDNSLGPGGDLRIYLEGLLRSEDVKTYVEQHPFGQNAINEMNSSWEFYSKVLKTLTKRVEHRSSSSHLYYN